MSTYCVSAQHLSMSASIYASSFEIVNIILSGLNYEYVREWIEIYEEIVNFIYFTNNKFKQLAVIKYKNM